MKANSTEKKGPLRSGLFLVMRLLSLLVIIPVLIPTGAFFVQALVWRYLLCRIDGITFMGGLLEAFALSLAMGGFAVCVSLFVSVAADMVKKIRKIPLEKFAQGKALEITSWSDMYKILPGFRRLFGHLAVNTLALAIFSSLQPVRLHFDGGFELLLASGVLSACWIFCMTAMSLAVYALVIKQQKARADAGKAVV